LFAIKGNLVFMNNLYHKFVVASVGIALGFTLGADKEAKAATFTFVPTYEFSVTKYPNDVYESFVTQNPFVSNRPIEQPAFPQETRVFYEFNLLNFDTNTVISQASLKADMGSSENINLQIFGYLDQRRLELSKFDFGGKFVASEQRPALGWSEGNRAFNVDVTGFVNDALNYKFAYNGGYPQDSNSLFNEDYPFAGFGIRTIPKDSEVFLSKATLEITTIDVAEPVPEPTTIFGSALALGVGGWLKRKKASQQNKTTLQN
jgi:hypothetical protein